ncbi:hypothetical protein V3C99_010388 [Haemonchus contortus]
MSHKAIDRLSREKKELSSRLKMKTENTDMSSSRINALRDETNEKQVEVAKAQREKKLAEAAQEKFQEDNVKLLSNINTLQEKYRNSGRMFLPNSIKEHKNHHVARASE